MSVSVEPVSATFDLFEIRRATMVRWFGDLFPGIAHATTDEELRESVQIAGQVARELHELAELLVRLSREERVEQVLEYLARRERAAGRVRCAKQWLTTLEAA
jgi:hypothetical protein